MSFNLDAKCAEAVRQIYRAPDADKAQWAYEDFVTSARSEAGDYILMNKPNRDEEDKIQEVLRTTQKVAFHALGSKNMLLADQGE